MKSWDLFDTLIGRKCGTAHDLFRQMGDNNFLRKRLAAERYYQDRKLPYTLEDIYERYGNPALAEVEFDLEKKNVFRIERYVSQLEPDDIIVSDMYLTETQLRVLMQVAGIDFPGKIYVSPYGKYQGHIWKTVLQEMPQSELIHTGDNDSTDIHGPQKYGIITRKADTDLLKSELAYGEPFGWWLRSQRLQLADNDNPHNLDFMEIEYNFPMLVAISNLLPEASKYYFMSRDCQLLFWVFTHLFPEKDAEYLYISRDALRHGGKEYKDYFNSRITNDSLIVDISSSLGSMQQALSWIKTKPRVFTAVFLASPFNIDTSGIDLQYIVTNTQTSINNTYLEMLNYANHDHVIDWKNDMPVFEPAEEYDAKLVDRYHKIIDKMLAAYPEEPIAVDYKKVFLTAIEGIQTHKNHIGRHFPRHTQIEISRKGRYRYTARETDPVSVVGAVCNYTWADIQYWWKSLIATGFKGDVHLIAYGDMDSRTKNILSSGGVVIHPVEFSTGSIVVDRFKDISRLLSTFQKDRWAVIADVGDIVFQFNPMHFLQGVSKDIVVTHEGVRFGNNKWTKINLMSSFPSHYHALKDEFFYNAGAIGGKAGILSRLALNTFEMCENVNAEAHDQAALNILLRQPPFYEKTLFLGPNDSWCFCGASSIFCQQKQTNYEGDPVKIEDGVCYAMPNMKTCMFHHYPRSNTIKNYVYRRVDMAYRKK